MESFDIHRSNLVGMGILPLQFEAGESAASLWLDASERFDLTVLAARFAADTNSTRGPVQVIATLENRKVKELNADVRIDAPANADDPRHAGILNHVLRRLAAR